MRQLRRSAAKKKKKKSIDEFLPGNIHTGMHYLPAVLQVRWLQLWVTTTAAMHPVCLSRPVVALMQWEKNSGEARKTPRYLKTNHSLSSCLWDPFGVWTAVSVSPKVCFKEPQYPPFDIKQSAFDPWTFDIPVKCRQSCFSCRRQFQSFGSGQEQPLLWLPSFCFAYQSSWQAAKSIPNWGRMASPVVLLKQLFSVVHPPACLPCCAGLTAGKEVVSCREEQSEIRVHTSNAFCLSALGKTAAFLATEKFLGLAVPCWDEWSVCSMPTSPAYLPVSFPREGGMSAHVRTLLSDLLPMYSALDPNYMHSPAEKEPSWDVCFLLKLLWPSSFLTRVQTLFSRGRFKNGIL